MTILTVSPYVSYPDIPHAGGQYLHAHLDALWRRHDGMLIAPDTPDNRHAVAVGGHAHAPILVPAAPSAGRWDRAMTIARRVAHPLRPEARFERALLAAIEERIDEVEAIELQWPEYAGLIPAIRARAPKLPIVMVEHDVLSQRVERDKTADSLRTRTRARLTAGRVVAGERRLLDRADRVLVFSAKDADLLRSNGVTSPVEVVLPPLEDPRMWRTSVLRSRRRRILFVAAFDREVNDAAARWLLAHVFPRVRASIPDAVVVLAGGGMRPDLQALAESTPGVELTGYVADLGAAYANADLAVAPLLAGAGLKFKVATALMWGLPVVTTTVGAEGYPTDRGLFAGIADDPTDFARLVIAALVGTSPASATARVGQAWALATFSQHSFEERLAAIYTAVLEPEPAGRSR